MRRWLYAFLALVLATGGLAAATLRQSAHAATTFYVSPSGNNSDGTSWANAWTNTTSINWASVPSGSVIELDGGASTCGTSPYDFGANTPNPGVNCGTTYAAFTVGSSNVTIERSTDAGHSGTVVIDGGRNTPLPYCGQASYSASAGASLGINLNGKTGVVIDGQARSGIIVRGAQNGVQMGSGGSDTLRNMELFDNGTFASHSWGYSTDGNDILLNGANNTYDRLLVHDGGQDEFHSYGSAVSEAGSIVENTWMGAERSDPTYAYEPFNDLQISGHDPGCTHADGIQIFAPAQTMSGFTVDHDWFGPGVNQGFYPNDSGTGTIFNNVTVTNSTFDDAAAHNIEVDHSTSSAPTGWDIENDTILSTQHGMEIPLATSGGTATMRNVIKEGGYVSASTGTWTTSGNDWYLGDPLPGSGNSNVNPGFTSAPTAADPSVASLYGVDLTPTVSGGSPLHTFSGMLSYIDSLNGPPPPQAPVVVTSAATGVSDTAATLNGTVNPESQATTYQFDYGTTTSYGSTIPVPAGSAGSGSSAVAETAGLTGLAQSTVYHYRIEATNATGTTLGSDQSFTTSATPVAPVVVTSAATGVTSSAATLNGTVNPEGQSTTYQFDYGPTTSYGTSVPVPAGSAGSGTSAVNESASLTGLTASTTYHYRIEATNATGTSFGSDQSFTTASAGGTCPVTEDASTPAAAHSGYGAASVTSASFSPPAGSMLEVEVITLQGGVGGVTTSLTDSKSDSYASGPSKESATTDAGVWFYHHYLATAPGSMTVTAHQSGSNTGTLQLVVRVVDGAASSQSGTGTTFDSSTATTAMNHAITTVTAGSEVYVAAANGDNASSRLTAISGTTNNDVWNDTHSGDVGATGRSTGNEGAAGSYTLGWTNSASDTFVWAAQEIQPATSC